MKLPLHFPHACGQTLIPMSYLAHTGLEGFKNWHQDLESLHTMDWSLRWELIISNQTFSCRRITININSILTINYYRLIHCIFYIYQDRRMLWCQWFDSLVYKESNCHKNLHYSDNYHQLLYTNLYLKQIFDTFMRSLKKKDDENTLFYSNRKWIFLLIYLRCE